MKYFPLILFTKKNSEDRIQHIDDHEMLSSRFFQGNIEQEGQFYAGYFFGLHPYAGQYLHFIPFCAEQTKRSSKTPRKHSQNKGIGGYTVILQGSHACQLSTSVYVLFLDVLGA